MSRLALTFTSIFLITKITILFLTMWWDANSIEQTVTKQFVKGRLKPQEAKRLDQIPSFGEELTDRTYWEFIDSKCKKLFLWLDDVGLPEQIFEFIDDSFDDDDLPFSLEQVQERELIPTKNERMETRFYGRQYKYLLRHLDKASHIDYGDPELVPLYIEAKQIAGQGRHVDKVTLPNQPGAVFCRAQIRLGTDHVDRGEFMSGINGIKGLQNEHMLSYWASYTHQGYGYILFTPTPEFSLKSLLTTMPSSLKKLDKNVRPQVVMNWIFCLADTVCSFHGQDRSHGNIRPSTVLFSKNNFVFLSGFTQLHINTLSDTAEGRSSDREAYDYGAPEEVNPAHLSTVSPGQSAGGSSHQVAEPNPKAADVFSLGCIILELLSFLLGKKGRAFAAHRAAKHRAAGRGSPLPDSSFHGNIGQVEIWMDQLAKDAAEKENDDPVFKGVRPILEVVVKMLSTNPSDRPTADHVREKIRQIVVEECGMPEPHCLRPGNSWDFGVDRRLSSISTLSSGSGSQHDSDRRRSTGSAGSPIAKAFNAILRGGSGEEVASRARNGSQSSYDSAQQALKHLEGASFFREFG
ncbi:kinase-like domain-containing protein [Chaetomium tenue]|uniref:Kinase-like domain-containing protein n=1 Tax=Chaetomium tenue TaxID=1854479 RepID=A0ACB7P0D3_9PEZI|nr:kinase-like domain-containing protein [Chaetomium globosum]